GFHRGNLWFVRELARKVTDVVFHSDFPELESVRASFVDRLVVSPTLMTDPVERDDHAGAVSSVVAMNERRLVFGRVDEREDLVDVLLRRPAEPGQRDVEVAHARLLDELLFVGG